jgi:hypothetical protein
MTDLPVSHCPWCGYAMDAATNPNDGATQPKPGDLSVCISCASVLVFNDDLTLRACSPAELAETSPDVMGRIERIQWAIRTTDRRGMKT